MFLCSVGSAQTTISSGEFSGTTSCPGRTSVVFPRKTRQERAPFPPPDVALGLRVYEASPACHECPGRFPGGLWRILISSSALPAIPRVSVAKLGLRTYVRSLTVAALMGSLVLSTTPSEPRPYGRGCFTAAHQFRARDSLPFPVASWTMPSAWFPPPPAFTGPRCGGFVLTSEAPRCSSADLKVSQKN